MEDLQNKINDVAASGGLPGVKGEPGFPGVKGEPGPPGVKGERGESGRDEKQESAQN